MNDDNLLLAFVAEATDMLDEIEPALIEMRNACDLTGQISMAHVNSIFRLMHSIKGSAGFFSLDSIVSVTHEAETLLDLFRLGWAKADCGSTAILCETFDFTRELLHLVEHNASDSGRESEAAGLVTRIAQVIALLKNHDQADAEPCDPCHPPDFAVPEDLGDFRMDTPEENLPDADEAPISLDLDGITPDMLERFIQEAEEFLESAEHSLLRLSDDPTVFPDAIAEAFRAMHSFKGNCGFMGQPDLERLSHATETVLQALKTGEVTSNPSVIASLLKITDILRSAVAVLAQGGSGNIQGCDILVELLEDSIPSGAAKSQDLAPASRAVAPQPTDVRPAPGVAAQAAQAQPQVNVMAVRPDGPKAAQPDALPVQPTTRRDIRVDLDKLDALIDLVGELVTAESMVTRNPELAGLELESFNHAAHLLRRIITDLQDVAMSVRMIPLAATFKKMIRLVHDVAVKSGKKVRLELVGEDTEVDKTVIELIADPLVHIVRNAVDHGVEPPDERLAQGKPEQGVVSIEAGHVGGEVLIVIRDDGRGLSRERILAKAVERGLIRGDGSDLADDDVWRLIFEPGFSTAETVTDISGRGVGMDVVKRNIEKLKGRVDVRVTPGRGSAVILRIPLTLAIMAGMLIKTGGNRYTLPILAIRESFRPTPEQITVAMDGQELVRVRQEVIPVVRLHQLLGLRPEREDLTDGILSIVEYGGRTICLFMDEILGEHQTVIKPLPEYIGDARYVSGCTILGDGEVSLILDVGAIIELTSRPLR